METISIITLGEAAVGKTSILKRITQKTYEDNYSITLSLDFLYLTKDYKNKSFNQIKYHFYDTAGGETYNALTKNYIRGRDIVLLVFCDIDSLEVLQRRWFGFIKDNADISKTKFIVVANKSDTFGDNYEKIKSKGKEFARDIDAFFITCSAKSKENMDNLEDHIEYEAIRVIEARQEQQKKSSNQNNKNSSENDRYKLDNKVSKKKSSCWLVNLFS